MARFAQIKLLPFTRRSAGHQDSSRDLSGLGKKNARPQGANALCHRAGRRRCESQPIIPLPWSLFTFCNNLFPRWRLRQPGLIPAGSAFHPRPAPPLLSPDPLIHQPALRPRIPFPHYPPTTLKKMQMLRPRTGSILPEDGTPQITDNTSTEKRRKASQQVPCHRELPGVPCSLLST